MSNTQSYLFPFLELPPEIREKIYILICHQSAPISLHIPASSPPQPTLDPSSQHHSFPHALLQTCTLIYNELCPIYFTHNTFTLSIRRRNDDWSYFFSHPFTDNRRQIRRLKIIIYRFGSHDFFTKHFVPILEDCIMNGQLRDLDVIVRESFLRGARHCEGALKGGFSDFAGLETLRDWVALRRLMLDPYLERKMLRSGNLDGGDENWADVDAVLDRGKLKINDVTWMLGEPGAQQGKVYGGRILG